METISRNVARSIIEAVGGSGEPPAYGFQFFTAALDEYLVPLENEYLASFIKEGGGSFKMVVGTYGIGKTHFLYNVREIAWKHGYAVSYVTLHPTYTPFYKLETVYQAIVTSLTYPMDPDEVISNRDRGIGVFIEKWFNNKKRELKAKGIRGHRLPQELRRYAASMRTFESVSFTNAVREAFLCLVEKRDDEYSKIIQWLKAEDYDRSKQYGLRAYGIMHKIDKSSAFRMIRSTISWIKAIGYTGVVVLLDEAEQGISISGKNKELLLSNLRELIDECTELSLSYSMFFYAIPDEDFFKGGARVYLALNQRLSTVFKTQNPIGVKIMLEDLSTAPGEVLREIGQKLARIFESYYQNRFDPRILKQAIGAIADVAYEQRFGDIGYKRLFVQSVIRGFQFLRANPTSVITKDMVKNGY